MVIRPRNHTLHEAGSAYRIQPYLRLNAHAADRSLALKIRHSDSDGPRGHCTSRSVPRFGHISRQFHRISSRSSNHATERRSRGGTSDWAGNGRGLRAPLTPPPDALRAFTQCTHLAYPGAGQPLRRNAGTDCGYASIFATSIRAAASPRAKSPGWHCGGGGGPASTAPVKSIGTRTAPAATASALG
jgi:hypothetical protein